MKMKKILLSALLLTFVFSCVSGKAVNAMESKKVVLDPLPKSAAEIKPANTPQQTAAYAIAALVRYTENAEAGIAMLDVLRGPRPLNNFNKQFLREIGMPTSLRELGLELDDAQLDALAYNCSFKGTRTVGSFKKLDQADMRAIYAAAR